MVCPSAVWWPCHLVSVLFSEPKIPQFEPDETVRSRVAVSVLFSEPKIPQWQMLAVRNRNTGEFQCSSASRKFLNRQAESADRPSPRTFQCSSASRKFLNRTQQSVRDVAVDGFSALQRAENSSMVAVGLPQPLRGGSFSALQRAENSSMRWSPSAGARCRQCFSALQRAENSSIDLERLDGCPPPSFQCSSASRKFLTARG